jgi:hypothetical protein
MDTSISKTDLENVLFKKLKILNETTWENRANREKISDWLNNYKDTNEKLNALYLLAQFMYFNSMQMRNLLKSLYRDLFKYQIIDKIRKDNGDTIDLDLIEERYSEQLNDTKFLGVGNPSESGVHLLYFFRQENKLSKRLFINVHEIFKRTNTGKIEFQYPDVKNYVFIDDFCGSGDQAKFYSSEIVEEIKKINPAINVSYLMLFATKKGKDIVLHETKFDKVEAVFELNDTFKCFDSSSRYFIHSPKEINFDFTLKFVGEYGEKLMKSIIKKENPRLEDNELENLAKLNKLGFKDGQLLIGFHHNTPDNSLPIFWYDEEDLPWNPIFRRYNKKYGLT